MKKFLGVLLTVVMIATLCIGSSVTALADESDQTLISVGGKTYGPWFGGTTTYYNNNPLPYLELADYMAAILAAAGGDAAGGPVGAGLGALIAKSVADAVDNAAADIEYIEGEVYKEYREVYVNGAFAYFQNRFTVTAYLVDSEGNSEEVDDSPWTEIYQSQNPMSIGDVDK